MVRIRQRARGDPLTLLWSIFAVPLGVEAFSVLVATAIAILAVGVVALLVGQCAIMPRIGRRWWVGLVPGYNLFALFCAARCQALLALYVIDAAFVFGFFLYPDPAIQELVWWPLGLGVLMVMWMSLCLAQRLRLGWGWQLLAFLLPSYAWCLIALLSCEVDESHVGWAARPFMWVERRLLGRSPEPAVPEEAMADAGDGEPGERLAVEPAVGETQRLPRAVPEADDGELEAERALGLGRDAEDAVALDGESLAESEGVAESGGPVESEGAGDAEAERDVELEPEHGNEPAPARDPSKKSTKQPSKRKRKLRRRRERQRRERELERARWEQSEHEPVEAADAMPEGMDGNEDRSEESPRGGPLMSDEQQGQAPEIPEGDGYEGEEAYASAEFDPIGDEEAEDEAIEGTAQAEARTWLDDEARALEEEPGLAEGPDGRPDDDISDDVASHIEGIYAELLGDPLVTQTVDEVDAEEAAYMEADAAYAREKILDETHDVPDGSGYAGRHLASAVKEVEDEEARERAAWDAARAKAKRFKPEGFESGAPKPSAPAQADEPAPDADSASGAESAGVNRDLNERLPNLD